MEKGKQDRKKTFLGKKRFLRKSPLVARDGRKGSRGMNVALGGKTLEDEGGYQICCEWVGLMRKSELKTMRCCLVGAAAWVAMNRWLCVVHLDGCSPVTGDKPLTVTILIGSFP